MTEDRILPNSILIELTVLGSFFNDKKTWLSFSPLINPEYFYNSEARKLFEYMQQSGCTDVLILGEKYPDCIEILSEASEQIGPKMFIEEEIKILRDKYERRKLIEAANNAIETAYNDTDMTGAEIIETTISKINENYIPQGKPQLLCEIAPKIIEDFKTKTAIGYQTGLADLDHVLGGFCKKELAIIAARTSMGKTALALQIARYNSIQQNIPILFFSLEMSKEAITGRLLFAEADQNYENALRGYKENLDLVESTYCSRLKGAPLYIDDSPGTTVNHIAAKTENLVKNHGIEIVIIDRIEYIKPTHMGRSTPEELSEISRSLIYTAKKLDVPIILIVQINRGPEQKEDKRPELSDLKGSGSHEENAVKVLMIYREEYYKRDTDKKGIAEILVRKNQNGRTGYKEVGFKKETMTFYNLSDRNENEVREPWANQI